MNEILDDLEDRQSGQPRGETTGTKRKRKAEVTKANKVLQKAEEALKRVEAEGTGGEEVKNIKGLNRKARRLLAQREMEAGGEQTKSSEVQGRADAKPKKSKSRKEEKERVEDKSTSKTVKSKPAKASRR
jgi:hypothetical protein